MEKQSVTSLLGRRVSKVPRGTITFYTSTERLMGFLHRDAKG